jgi:hypothetical protein
LPVFVTDSDANRSVRLRAHFAQDAFRHLRLELPSHERRFQSLWAEFASLFRAPVVPVFCAHLPGGRYRLTFDAPFHVARGNEAEAVSRYVARLESVILADPADAVGHLLWPCYGPPARHAVLAPRPGRRVAAVSHL